MDNHHLEPHRWKPGKSGNQSGLTAREHRIKHMVLGLGLKAGKRLEQLLDSEDEAIALGAIKEVLSRAAPAPKTQNNLTIVDLTGAHLHALKMLSDRGTDQGQREVGRDVEDVKRPARALSVTDVDDQAAE